MSFTPFPGRDWGRGRSALDSARSGLHSAWTHAAQSRFGRGLRISLITIHALLLREAVTRYGRRSAGYAWALIEPMLQVGAMIALFSFINRAPAAGDSLVVFFLTGIMPLLVFRGALVRGAGAINSNLTLMDYPQVRGFEVITARMLLEAVNNTMVILILVLIMKVFTGLPISSWVSEPLSLLGALGTLMILSYGACFMSAQIGRILPLWSTLMGLSGRILFFTSGVWFTLGSLAPGLRSYAVYNPLAHVIEHIRDAAITGFDSTHYSIMYPIQFGVVFLFIGLFMEWIIRLGGYDLRGRG